MLKYDYEIYSKKNSLAEDKPNEDLAVWDEKLHAGAVLDGVSRDRENGKYPDPSPAKAAADLFADAVLREAGKKAESGISRIQSMICSGNDRLKKYNHELKHRFPAGTVGIVFSIEDDKLFYGYIGDCYAAIIRDGKMRVFTECQTAEITRHKKEFTSDEIRFEICNHVSHPYGYGVWDGSENAMDYVKYGSIRISEGDVLFMFTDGMKETIDGMEPAGLMRNTIGRIDAIRSNSSKDDRTCIKMCFKSFAGKNSF